MSRLTEPSARRTLATHRDTPRGAHMRSVFAVCDVNSFNRWRVVLGKQLANRVVAEVESPEAGAQHDASTTALIRSLLQERDLGP